MAVGKPSEKRLLINQANSRIVAVTTAASFIVVFCLVASYTLVGQLAYQNRGLGKKKAALSQLKTDINSVQTLETSYTAFVQTPQNVLGGNTHGQGGMDGDNAKIVLDALPSKYDFPALATSLEKLALSQGVNIESMTGTDDEVAQTDSASSTPAPIAMPFQITVTGNYASIQKVVKAFEQSIRPIQIQTLQLTGSDQKMQMNITAQTYYQPEKTLNIKTEVVK
jgi:Tfp pilus assembly protein PilO